MKAPALAAVGSLLAATAHAAPCAPRDVIEQSLWDSHQERPVGRALQKDGHMVEVWAAKDGGTYSITLTRPDGIACIVSFGHAWEAMDLGALGEAS